VLLKHGRHTHVASCRIATPGRISCAVPVLLSHHWPLTRLRVVCCFARALACGIELSRPLPKYIRSHSRTRRFNSARTSGSCNFTIHSTCYDVIRVDLPLPPVLRCASNPRRVTPAPTASCRYVASPSTFAAPYLPPLPPRGPWSACIRAVPSAAVLAKLPPCAASLPDVRVCPEPPRLSSIRARPNRARPWPASRCCSTRALQRCTASACRSRPRVLLPASPARPCSAPALPESHRSNACSCAACVLPPLAHLCRVPSVSAPPARARLRPCARRRRQRTPSRPALLACAHRSGRLSRRALLRQLPSPCRAAAASASRPHGAAARAMPRPASRPSACWRRGREAGEKEAPPVEEEKKETRGRKRNRGEREKRLHKDLCAILENYRDLSVKHKFPINLKPERRNAQNESWRVFQTLQHCYRTQVQKLKT
jgi:hypothetical protein